MPTNLVRSSGPFLDPSIRLNKREIPVTSFIHKCYRTKLGGTQALCLQPLNRWKFAICKWGFDIRGRFGNLWRLKCSRGARTYSAKTPNIEEWVKR
jgi:hypothetical protein